METENAIFLYSGEHYIDWRDDIYINFSDGTNYCLGQVIDNDFKTMVHQSRFLELFTYSNKNKLEIKNSN